MKNSVGSGEAAVESQGKKQTCQRLPYNVERRIRYFCELDSYLRYFSPAPRDCVKWISPGSFYLPSLLNPFLTLLIQKMKVLRACHDNRCFIPLHFKINIALES